MFEVGIAALARADAEELERLAAARAMPPQSEEEARAARQHQRTFGRLLQLTGRNLRVLRGRSACGYGAPLD